jgi:D-alanyl-lipoteichoic acid acyltransferase DltB (MBOAT superfamily)
MVFNSITFLVFFAVVLGVYALPIPWRVKKLHLLLSSYLFYAAWNPPFVVLIWVSTLVDWLVAARMPRATSPFRRKVLLLASLGTNLGLLGFFKYGNFLLENFVTIAASLGVDYQPPRLDIFLPIGISFYTFQTLSYTIDVYRGAFRPWHSFLDFALFVTFFPQLVSGPILRASHFLPQCVEPKRMSGQKLGRGLSLLALGLFEKVVLADRLMAPVADAVYGAASRAGFVDAWLGTLAFSAQIFFDFAGYSTCAIGVGLCLGFDLPENFRFPYGAVGFSDFWRRWHVSLSSWLRDYLYIPLGGNRKGKARAGVNLLTTMLLGGLWHGAAWRFVIWGGLHGLYLAAERRLRERWGAARWVSTWYGRVALMLVTYGLVCVTWVFFRAPDIESALALTKIMFAGGPNDLVLGMPQAATVAVITVLLLFGHWYFRDTTLEQAVGGAPWWVRGLMLGGILAALLLVPGDNRAFIYFQF